MVDALAVQAARAADQSVDLVVGLAQEQLGEIRPVLAGDSRDQVHVSWSLFPVHRARPARHGT